MSGHSKWANIKHKKGAADARRGKVFSKIAKELTIAARSGADPSANPTLRTLIQKARAVNMPADNVDRAIKKGTGELQGASAFEEIMFEGYAGGGVAIVVQCLSDNRNRTVAEVRHTFNRHGGSFATQGSVLRGFQRKGAILVDAGAIEEDRLMELILEAGAEDMERSGDSYEIVTDPSAHNDVVDALTKAGIEPKNSEVGLVPDTYVPVADKELASKLLRFTEELEDLDDVQNVYSNCDIDEGLMASLAEE